MVEWTTCHLDDSPSSFASNLNEPAKMEIDMSRSKWSNSEEEGESEEQCGSITFENMFEYTCFV